eukprot:1184871-Prorocentrum_minimum.AAC.1
MVMSAVVHDFEHPGFNNAYAVTRGLEVALIYNGQSVSWTPLDTDMYGFRKDSAGKSIELSSDQMASYKVFAVDSTVSVSSPTALPVFAEVGSDFGGGIGVAD